MENITANSKFENAVASLTAGIRAGLKAADAEMIALMSGRQLSGLNA